MTAWYVLATVLVTVGATLTLREPARTPESMESLDQSMIRTRSMQ